eukprot:CAMPEP_0181083872 /NCGR_PEP_ID=MMETSP1071-20121207/4395_1 /TAXON_ID=35127 /ORGANISM="Thalassiosira sp., Strain NH16" /LENGTH=201 /DNA_ID=CAMNT_0023165571 /DNA_START=23 /DNA_END=628 /DNA_ORIENTATION=+
MMQRLVTIVLLALSSPIQCGAAQSGLRAAPQSYAADLKSRQLSFWGYLSNALLHPPNSSSSGSSSGGSSGSSSGGSSSSSSYNGATSSSGGDGEGEAEIQSQYLENSGSGGDNAKSGQKLLNPTGIWVFLGLALIAGAVGAVAIKKRKQAQAAALLDGSRKTRSRGLTKEKKVQDTGAFIEVVHVKNGSYKAPHGPASVSR